MKIDGKVAVITGGASGLGAATARMFVEAGGRATILDVNEALARAGASSLGASAQAAVADVADGEQVARVIEETRARWGRLDVAVSCAGIGGARRVIGREGPVELEWFERIVRVNLIGTFNVARLAAAAMALNEPGEGGERGVIVNTASIAAFDGQIGQTAYSASKGGIAGMTLPLARDLARHGIRVATIAPGIFDTPLLGQLPEDVRGSLAASVPFPQRLGRPADYAALARHIIENGYLNGEVIRLDAALRMAPK
jgi:NAD(P)-dependent dehydrogenase (short-subunit alcohol dehydrogenase family)